MVQGQQIFRFDSYGDEKFRGDTLLLHQAITDQEKLDLVEYLKSL